MRILFINTSASWDRSAIFHECGFDVEIIQFNDITNENDKIQNIITQIKKNDPNFKIMLDKRTNQLQLLVDSVADFHKIQSPLVKKRIIGIDGGCSKNGTANARGAFGIYFTEGILFEEYMSGSSNMTFNLASNGRLIPAKYDSAMTNNRAEYTAGLIALWIIFQLGLDDVEIICDSMLFCRTIQQWYPKREQENELSDLKNLDLLTPAYKYYKNTIDAGGSITITHIKSHTPRPPADSPILYQWTANNSADILCKKFLTLNTNGCTSNIGTRGQPERVFTTPFLAKFCRSQGINWGYE